MEKTPELNYENVLAWAKLWLEEDMMVNDPKSLTESTTIDDVGVDSLDLVEAVIAFEDHFSVEVPDLNFPTTATLKEICTTLVEKSKSD